ncbi:MAG: protein kinase [Gemmatimonadetes bacterium]|nr:protein kinase [Gemmatimonadota bacterium]
MQITRGVAGALDYAHRCGVVHRDIKPENILLQGNVAIVADFGIARALTDGDSDRLTMTGMAVGTPAYFSPEQAVGSGSLDGRSDIYSLACVLYEMLTGDPPFAGATIEQTLARRLTESPPWVTQTRNDVPSGVDQAIRRALARDPADRFAAAADFAHSLSGTATRSEQSGLFERTDRSIAVLPFANLSADADNEYFSDGITEEIINVLSGIASIRVTARTSAFAFKGVTRDIREIGAKLKVGAVLEGSVRKVGNRVRITAQLVDAISGNPVWSERYDRELEDVFAIQDEIAAIIVRRLRAEMFEGAPRRRERPTASLEAYDAYLRGRFYFQKGTADHYRKSIDFYRRALSLDPDYAQAHVALAETLVFSSILGAPAKDAFEEARNLVHRAIRLDDRLADAHAMRGYVAFWVEWSWSEVESSFQRALVLNPNSATAHDYYSVFLSTLGGRGPDAIALSKRSVELDPLSVVAHQELQWAFFQDGKYPESLEAGARALELVPDYVLAHNATGWAMLELKRYREALQAFERAIKASSNDPLGRSGVIVTLARMGSTADAESQLNGILPKAEVGTFPSSCTAWAFAALERLDEAFYWVERAIDIHDPFVTCLSSFPMWDPLRPDPRFGMVLGKMRFPPWALARAEFRRELVAAASGSAVGTR